MVGSDWVNKKVLCLVFYTKNVVSLLYKGPGWLNELGRWI